jgi:hypothetical protein
VLHACCLHLPNTNTITKHTTQQQLGGKGANLCEMAKCGVNVPPGLTITTEVCEEFYRVGESSVVVWWLFSVSQCMLLVGGCVRPSALLTPTTTHPTHNAQLITRR